MKIFNNDCLEEMKNLPDKSIDLFICDLPYGETNCSWDNVIDMQEFWKQFKRLRKNKRVACIHFCSTKFGYSLIKSWEKGFKMDLVWKKRNKTGALQSKYRPMRNHEMIYFFYEQTPKYNRDKYHKRINNVMLSKSDTTNVKKSDAIENKKIERKTANFEPVQPASIIEEDSWGEGKNNRNKRYLQYGPGYYEPANPDSIFESEKVFTGKRHHQTQKPQDILEFFLKYWTDEGDVVLDPTMGSGSTGVACKNLNREFIGIELNKEIFEIAKNRLAENKM